ncbi:MAG TPA: arsenic transporter [Acidobacteriaceae bacterium]|nr:arsenic transporter [Acidobacteriaceae bacterium]
MFHLAPPHTVFIWILSLAAIACMLLRPWGLREAVWVSAGAILLIVLRLITPDFALNAAGEGIDVYLFLTGMMLLAELARHEGVFDWIADIAVRRSGGSASRLFLLIYCAGIAVTALLSNDATAVVLTPAILAAVRRARVEPKAYLLACALVANAASFLLPISNPANLVVYGDHMPPLGTWLRIFLLPAIAAILVTYLCLHFLSRRSLASEIKAQDGRVSLTSPGRSAFGGLIFAAAVLLTASGLGVPLGIPTCAAAVAVMLVVGFKDRSIFRRAVVGISWSVLPLVAGLFVLVEALNSAGLLRLIEASFKWMLSQPRIIANLAAGGGAALFDNVMNNLPVGLAGGAALRMTPQLSHAVLIGVNIGPNLSVTGSLATILWLMALRREDVGMTRAQFFKTGLVVTPAALVCSLLALWFTT